MKKRIISTILVLSFVLSMIPAALSAAPVKASTTTTAAQDGYSVVSGNDDTITKDFDGTYLVSRKGAKDTIVKKGNGTLEEGWIMLDMPVGTALQMRRRQGIVFGANDLANLASGTHYYAYIECTNDSKEQYVRIAEVKDGVITKLNSDLKLDDILANVETVGLDSIELSVYFTKDGVIKLYLQDICIYTTTGKTISGSQYGLCLADSISGKTARVTANYAFNSLSTKGFGDYNLYYGGWDMGANGITSTKNFNSGAIDDRSFWLAKDTHATESVFRFSIKDYKNAPSGTYKKENGEHVLDANGDKIPDESTQSGIVIGVTAPSVEQNKGFYNGNSYAYYFIYLQYRGDSKEALIGIARSDKKMTGSGWTSIGDAEKSITWFGGDYADSTGNKGDSDTLSDWVQAGKGINGFVYYNATTGEIKVSLDGGKNNTLSWTDPELANRTNANGRGYGVRTNACGVAVDVEAIDVVSHESSQFTDIRGDFIYLEDGSAYALKSSIAYSKDAIKGNDVWYSFEGTDFGTADTGFLLGTHKDADYSGEWEGKIHGYCLFVYNNGEICIGAFGIEYYNESKQQNSTWYQVGKKNLKSTTYWMKDADTVSAESEGIYHIRVHQVYDPVANTNTFDVYVGGIYISTFTDASGRAFSPDGGHYGYRNNQAGVFLANSADMVEYPDYLDTEAKEHSLVNRSVKRAIAYDEATGFFRNAFLDDQNINMSNEKVTIPTTGKTTVYYSVDMQKLRYGMNADDGLVFGASYSDANYNGSATWYCLVLGDQRDAGAVRERNLRLLKYTGAIEEGQSAPNAFPEVSNGYSTDKITTLTKFDYTPGDVVRIKVAVEYDFNNNTTTINAYANGVHTFKFVDTVANEGKNDKTPSVGTYALTGTGVGVRTEASQTSWANLTVSLTEMDDLPPVQEVPTPSVPSAPVTFDGTAIWVSIVSLASLAVGAVVSFNKKERA